MKPPVNQVMVLCKVRVNILDHNRWQSAYNGQEGTVVWVDANAYPRPIYLLLMNNGDYVPLSGESNLTCNGECAELSSILGQNFEVSFDTEDGPAAQREGVYRIENGFWTPFWFKQDAESAATAHNHSMTSSGLHALIVTMPLSKPITWETVCETLADILNRERPTIVTAFDSLLLK